MAEYPHDRHDSLPSSEKTDGEYEISPKGRPYSDLEKEFLEWLESVSVEDFDETLLNAFLEELEKQHPMDVAFDSQASLERFHKRFAPLFEAQGEATVRESFQPSTDRLGRHARRLMTIAATIAAMLAVMIGAQAFGIDVFGFFANWTDEIFYFSRSASETYDAPTYPLAMDESAEYETIEEALSAFQIDAAVAPSWYPDGLGNLKVRATVSAFGMEIYAASDGDGPFFTLTICDFDRDVGPTYIIEKDDSDVTLYETGERTHYIFKDGELCKATWIVNGLQCIMTGEFTKNEILRMIDSIYEVD